MPSLIKITDLPVRLYSTQQVINKKSPLQERAKGEIAK